MATRLSDGDDRFANEAGPEQRRLPEVPRRAHLVQVHADEVRGEHPDDLLDLEGREPERLRISDGRRERRIHAVDVDREVHLVAVDGLHRALDRCADPSLVDVEDADVGQTEPLEILPLLASAEARRGGLPPRGAGGSAGGPRGGPIMWAPKLSEASRTARGAKRDPPRNEHVRSYGTPNKTIRASSYFATASAKRGAAMGEPKSHALI